MRRALSNASVVLAACACTSAMAGATPVLAQAGAAHVGAAQPARVIPLPARMSDAEFWRMVTSMSETGAERPPERLVSNEIDYAPVVALLEADHRSGGAYVGVGNEQNFHYIAAVHPGIAFIVDSSRETIMEHLVFKAIFEMAADRADFVSLLFAKPRPRGLGARSSIREIWDAYWTVASDSALHARTLASIEARLTRTRGFMLGDRDLALVRRAYDAFYERGPIISNWGVGQTWWGAPVSAAGGHGAQPTDTAEPPMRILATGGGASTVDMVEDCSGPSRITGNWECVVNRTLSIPLKPGDRLVSRFGGLNFATLMMVGDESGTPRSFLASEARYRDIRTMQQRNLVVPLVGALDGAKALPSVADYLAAHGTVLGVLYPSNIELVLWRNSVNRDWFYATIARMPHDAATVVIRPIATITSSMPGFDGVPHGEVRQGANGESLVALFEGMTVPARNDWPSSLIAAQHVCSVVDLLRALDGRRISGVFSFGPCAR
jgi:hypothetical protein